MDEMFALLMQSFDSLIRCGRQRVRERPLHQEELKGLVGLFMLPASAALHSLYKFIESYQSLAVQETTH